MVKEVLALNVRMQREKRGVTIRDLAKLINVSPSFLSQVENGKTIPSLVTLKRLADALNTTIGRLVGEDEKLNDHNPIVKKSNRIKLKNIGQRLEVELLSPQDANNEMQSYMIYFDRNGDTGMFGSHEGQESGFILKGVLELYYNNKKYVLREGDAFYIDSNIPHHLKNIDDGKSRVLIVSSVPRF